MSAEGNEGANNQESTAPVIEIDAYEPSEMAARVGLVGISKTNLGALTMLGLSILAGVSIALGTQLSILATHTATSNYGLNQLISGVAFTLAMVLIVITETFLYLHGRDFW